MFQNPEVAKTILQQFLSINGEMNESIEVVESKISAEELKAFKTGVGYVMYKVFDKIIEPIRKLHPALRPPEIDACRPWYSPS